MYKILHIPTSTVVYRQFMDILSSVREYEFAKIPLSFYSYKEATRALRKIMHLITVYNRSRYPLIITHNGPIPSSSPTTIRFNQYKKYIKQNMILCQGYNGERYNKITFYGNIMPIAEIVDIPIDFIHRINIDRSEFLIIRDPCQ